MTRFLYGTDVVCEHPSPGLSRGRTAESAHEDRKRYFGDVVVRGGYKKGSVQKSDSISKRHSIRGGPGGVNLKSGKERGGGQGQEKRLRRPRARRSMTKS